MIIEYEVKFKYEDKPITFCGRHKDEQRFFERKKAWKTYSYLRVDQKRVNFD